MTVALLGQWQAATTGLVESADYLNEERYIHNFNAQLTHCHAQHINVYVQYLATNQI